MVNFRSITEENFDAIINMRRPEDENYLASNEHSLAQAWLYREANDVFPFAIYDDDLPIGFMMLDEDLENRTIAIWRIMFPLEYQNKGYGTEALRKVIALMQKSGKYDYVSIDYVQGNDIAGHVYRKVGFHETGQIVNGREVEMRLEL
ncbi:MAG: GNAT family N-acetyltransferase [Roseburia sp.]